MKNSDKILLLIGIVVVVGGLFIYSTKADEVLECTLPNNTAGLNKVTYDEYECLLEDEAIDIVYIGSATCGYCTKFSPVIEAVGLKYNIPVYYLDVASINEDEYNKLLTSISYFAENDGKWGTPTTFILKGNKVRDVLNGYTEEEPVIEFLKENNLINGE